MGLSHPGICPYGVFTSQDGVHFILSIQNEREWQRLCEAGLQRPDLISDSRTQTNTLRVEHREFVDGAVQAAFSKRRYTDLEVSLNGADLAFAPVNSIDKLKTHPDFHHFAVLLDGQRVELPLVPGLAKPGDLTVPALGEHTAVVLQWLQSDA